MIPGLISRGRRWRMYYELYIDVFFLENLMMDSLILLALDHILKCGGNGDAFSYAPRWAVCSPVRRSRRLCRV